MSRKRSRADEEAAEEEKSELAMPTSTSTSTSLAGAVVAIAPERAFAALRVSMWGSSLRALGAVWVPKAAPLPEPPAGTPAGRAVFVVAASTTATDAAALAGRSWDDLCKTWTEAWAASPFAASGVPRERWFRNPGPTSLHLHGAALVWVAEGATPSERVAAFDVDDTLLPSELAKPGSKKSGAAGAGGKVSSSSSSSPSTSSSSSSVPRSWLFPSIPTTLRGLQDAGFRIVLLTNQKGISTGHVAESHVTDRLTRLALALREDAGVHATILAAPEDDLFRKPRVGLWWLLQAHLNDGRWIDPARSLFVGDAAGRPKTPTRPKDFSASDAKCAANLGLWFATPEVAFAGARDPLHANPARWDWGAFVPCRDLVFSTSGGASAGGSAGGGGGGGRSGSGVGVGSESLSSSEDAEGNEGEAAVRLFRVMTRREEGRSAAMQALRSHPRGDVPRGDDARSTLWRVVARGVGEGPEVLVLVGSMGSGKSFLARLLERGGEGDPSTSSSASTASSSSSSPTSSTSSTLSSSSLSTSSSGGSKRARGSGYVRINQDALKTKARCLSAAEEALRAGQSVVVDATNRDEATRADWLALAAREGVPARAVALLVPRDVAFHRITFREIRPRDVAVEDAVQASVPSMVVHGFFNNVRWPVVAAPLARASAAAAAAATTEATTVGAVLVRDGSPLPPLTLGSTDKRLGAVVGDGEAWEEVLWLALGPGPFASATERALYFSWLDG